MIIGSLTVAAVSVCIVCPPRRQAQVEATASWTGSSGRANYLTKLSVPRELLAAVFVPCWRRTQGRTDAGACERQVPAAYRFAEFELTCERGA